MKEAAELSTPTPDYQVISLFDCRGNPISLGVTHPTKLYMFAFFLTRLLLWRKTYLSGISRFEDQETQISKFALLSWLNSSNCWNMLSHRVSQGGVYHGRILVPADYPMKPPDIIVLTPNGRFSVLIRNIFITPSIELQIWGWKKDLSLNLWSSPRDLAG